MIHLLSTDRITICGLPGTGKTTFAKFLAKQYGDNILIYDPLLQYRTFPDKNRYIPKNNSIAEFDSVCAQLCNQENRVFLIEEAERYLGQGKPIYDNTFDLINRGRNWGIGVIVVTRRIQRLSKDFFDLCQHIFFFHCGVQSRRYITDLVGRELSLQIVDLEKYQFLHYDVENDEVEIKRLRLTGDTQKLVKDEKDILKEEEAKSRIPKSDKDIQTEKVKQQDGRGSNLRVEEANEMAIEKPKRDRRETWS